MGVISSRFEKRDLGDLANPSERLIKLLGGTAASKSGVVVTPSTAMQSAAVFACVRVLAETISTLPLHLYERLEKGKNRASAHRLYRLLHEAPNPEMTSVELREALQGHLCLRGNAFCEIEYDNAGRAIALWPLLPDAVSVRRANGGLVYSVTLPQDRGSAQLEAWRILHLRGLSSNGIWGLSPIALAREAIALSLAAEEYGARFFSNGATPGGLLSHPGLLGEKGRANLRKSFEETTQGLSRAHRLAILEEGVQYTQIGIAPEEAQFLETRKFQVSEIARIFRVPPHLIGDLEKATFSNIEHQGIEFVTHTIRPWLVRWEQRLNQALLSEGERSKYFFEFLVDGLLRGDAKSRWEGYRIAREIGALNADEIREMENRNPRDDGRGGDYLMPLNMAPVTEVQLKRSIELRSNTPGSRKKIRDAYKPILADMGSRITRRETQDVLRLAKKTLRNRDTGNLESALDDYYEGDFKSFLQKQAAPVVASLGVAIVGAAEEETGKTVSKAEIDRFSSEYTEALTAKHIRSSKGQIRAVAQRAAEENQDPYAAVEERLSEWEETRPEKIAAREAVKIDGAFSSKVFALAGILRLKSQATGKSCPYCLSLDGKIVGIGEPFLEAGEFVAEGAADPMKIDGIKRHPPYHSGCDCSVMPVIDLI